MLFLNLLPLTFRQSTFCKKIPSALPNSFKLSPLLISRGASLNQYLQMFFLLVPSIACKRGFADSTTRILFKSHTCLSQTISRQFLQTSWLLCFGVPYPCRLHYFMLWGPSLINSLSLSRLTMLRNWHFSLQYWQHYELLTTALFKFTYETENQGSLPFLVDFVARIPKMSSPSIILLKKVSLFLYHPMLAFLYLCCIACLLWFPLTQFFFGRKKNSY